jgi:hypothetical protein
MAGLDGIKNKIDPGGPMDKDLYDLPPEELKKIPTVCGSLREALGGEVLSRAARRVTPGAEMVAAQSIFTARPDPARMPAPMPPESVVDSVAESVANDPAEPEGAALWSAAAKPQAGDPADTDLAAIRALIGDPPPSPSPSPSPRPLRPVARPATADPTPAPRPAATGWRREWLADTLATGLGYGLLVVSVPVGAVRAALAHLNGEDLRKLVAEG